MRLRNVKNARDILNSSSYFEKCPENFKGKVSTLFSNDFPIHLEIGCGKGQFLIEMAKKYKNICFIGIEKYDSVLVRAIQKCEKEHLNNLKFFCMDAKQLDTVFDHEIQTVYLNFSDPWPKNRHHGRRLTSSTFLTLYDGIFKGNGHIIQKTDNVILFASSLEDLSQYGYVFSKVSLDLHKTDLSNVMTEYEERFSSLGYPIYYLEAYKKSERI